MNGLNRVHSTPMHSALAPDVPLDLSMPPDGGGGAVASLDSVDSGFWRSAF